MATAALLLAACEPIGEGRTLRGLFIGTSTGVADFQIHECYSDTLYAGAIFDGEGDATIADVSVLAQWSSDNPGVAAVSNGELRAATGQQWPPGAVVARSPGVATVSTSYLGFTAARTVTVMPTRLAISPELTDIAQDLSQQFALEATVVDGVTDIDPVGDAARMHTQWRFAGSSAAAFVDRAGVVQANSASSEALTLVAELPDCGREARAAFRVSPIEQLHLDYELGAVATLPIGTSESFTVEAVFATPGSTRQNLVAAVDIDNPYDDELLVRRGAERIVIQALAEVAGATLPLSLYEGALLIATKPLTVVESELLSIAVEPPSLRVTYPGEGTLRAVGTFANGQSLPISRHVVWAVESPADIDAPFVSNGLDDAGRVYVPDLDLAATLTAYAPTATEDGADNADLIVKAAP